MIVFTCLLTISQPCPLKIGVSTATQSSTWTYNGDTLATNYALDGLLKTVSHTLPGISSWLKLQLATVFCIDGVIVFNGRKNQFAKTLYGANMSVVNSLNEGRQFSLLQN